MTTAERRASPRKKDDDGTGGTPVATGDASSRSPSRPSVARLALCVSWGCALSVGAYAILRATQAVGSPPPDPRAMGWARHAGYFWRAWTAGYVGALASFIVAVVDARVPGALARALPAAIAICASLLIVQTLVWP